MSKYVVKNGYSQYYVKGKGFVGTKATATQLDSSEATSVKNCAVNMGVYYPTVEQLNQSFAVFYIRPGDVRADGSVAANTLSPSSRRFATRAEAVTHGKRFDTRTKRGTTELVGHIGFYVKESTDAVNAYVNSSTGLTNGL